jgi:hypothetical protein
VHLHAEAVTDLISLAPAMQIDDACEVYITDSIGTKIWTTGTYLSFETNDQSDQGGQSDPETNDLGNQSDL